MTAPNARHTLIKLPEDVPTDTQCIQITIPAGTEYIAILAGALRHLTYWSSYQRDSAHTAKDVAQAWYDALQVDWTTCAGQPIIRSVTYENEDPMPIRTDCDCNVWILCCDGTEKQILTSAQVKALIDGTTPGNAPQPSPGGCVTYHNYVTGLATELVPTPVSTGDTVEIQNITGGTNGNNIARWNCGTGDEYFGGGCVGFPDTNASNRLPSVPTGTIIVGIAGTWYDGRSIITVPGGVTDVQPVVALNYDPTYQVSGTITYDVQVCNNQTATWTHTADFALTPDGFVGGLDGSDGAQTVWVSGTGWQSADGTPGGFPHHYAIILTRAFTATNITNITFYYTNSLTPGTVFATYSDLELLGSVVSSGSIDTTAGSHVDSWSPNTTGDNIHWSQSLDNNPAGLITVTGWSISGTGTNPF